MIVVIGNDWCELMRNFQQDLPVYTVQSDSVSTSLVTSSSPKAPYRTLINSLSHRKPRPVWAALVIISKGLVTFKYSNAFKTSFLHLLDSIIGN